MIRRLFVLAFVFTAAFGRPVAADPLPFVAGIAAATVGDHAAAAVAFERALDARGWSAGTLFDLGNAYASAGRPGPAILAYERARSLAPRDRAIASNLAHTREAAGVNVPSLPRFTTTLATLTSDEWTWLAIACALFAGLGIVGFAWSIRRRAGAMLAIAAAIASAFAITAAVRVAPSPDDAVIVHADSARIAPYAGAEEAFAAPEGESVRIEQRHGAFVYVRDGDRTGWVPTTAVECVISDRVRARRT